MGVLPFLVRAYSLSGVPSSRARMCCSAWSLELREGRGGGSGTPGVMLIGPQGLRQSHGSKGRAQAPGCTDETLRAGGQRIQAPGCAIHDAPCTISVPARAEQGMKNDLRT